MPSGEQLALHLPAPPVSDGMPLIPARMVNEFVYCPRLAYLMWAQAEWVDTGDTVEGRRVHKRVDQPNAPLPPPGVLTGDTNAAGAEEAAGIISRSMTLSSETLGVIARLDVVEAEDGVVTPIDFKRGKRPHIARGAYEPERVQVCLQGLLLEEHGYRVEEGAIYYAASRERVWVPFDDALRTTARTAISDLRLIVSQNRVPPPLSDSPKCPRCALVSVCMPDEVRALNGSALAPRSIAVPADTAMPLVVQSQEARISKVGDTLKIIEAEQEETRVRFIDISDVALFGNVSITTPALSALLDREIPVSFHSHGGWFRGIAHGLGHRNVELRAAQYAMSFDSAACLRFARALIAAKITNQRTILRRNWHGAPQDRKAVLDRLTAARKSVGGAETQARLLGLEGDAAAVYFRAFAELIAAPNPDEASVGFDFAARNRRPPADPVNALLSLAYAMLTRHLTVALNSVGFDPYRGFFHTSRYGRPALALDIMEPFRPVIADSVVLTAINNGELRPADFVVATTGTALTRNARRRFVQTFERRLSQETTHPVFGYRVSMRRMLIVQARLLSRFLLGDLRSYPHYLPR